MSVSAALEKSARDFCIKYYCDFDFNAFEARVEEFTFLRPAGGWVDVYKTTFDRLYKDTLEKIVTGAAEGNIDAESMLDDFEYTLIRPYVRERGDEIRHKPYVGMDDRVARLEYLDRLTKDTPSDPVALFTEKYKNGALTLAHMLKRVESVEKSGEIKDFIEIAGYAQALENVNNSRSAVWRAVHPIKNSAEQRETQHMKKILSDSALGGEERYREFASEAQKPVDGYERMRACLEQSMARAREDTAMKQKMNMAVRESLHIEEFDRAPVRDRAPRVSEHSMPVAERQNKK